MSVSHAFLIAHYWVFKNKWSSRKMKADDIKSIRTSLHLGWNTNVARSCHRNVDYPADLLQTNPKGVSPLGFRHLLLKVSDAPTLQAK